MNIAILDSERLRAERVFRSLSVAGYVCRIFRSRRRLVDALDTRAIDILLLDIEKADGELLAAMMRFREKGAGKMLVFAETGQVDVVREGLAAGADDYLCFPLRQHELQMRVSVLARQIFPDAQSHWHLKYGGFEFARYPNALRHMGREIRLTAREFDLALLFFRHIGEPLSRAHIAEAIWKKDSNEMARSVDTHVSRIRNKLNLKPQNGFLLEQVYGFGYRLHSLGEP